MQIWPIDPGVTQAFVQLPMTPDRKHVPSILKHGPVGLPILIDEKKVNSEDDNGNQNIRYVQEDMEQQNIER